MKERNKGWKEEGTNERIEDRRKQTKNKERKRGRMNEGKKKVQQENRRKSQQCFKIRSKNGKGAWR
jgi:hypothetical protein